MSLYKRHKKEERGNKESDRVFSIGSKTKMETDMHDLPSFLVLRKRCLDICKTLMGKCKSIIWVPLRG